MKQKEENLKTRIFEIENIKCGSCIIEIKEALKQNGIKEITTNPLLRIIKIKYDSNLLSSKNIKKILKNKGFLTESKNIKFLEIIILLIFSSILQYILNFKKIINIWNFLIPITNFIYIFKKKKNLITNYNFLSAIYYLLSAFIKYLYNLDPNIYILNGYIILIFLFFREFLFEYVFYQARNFINQISDKNEKFFDINQNVNKKLDQIKVGDEILIEKNQFLYFDCKVVRGVFTVDESLMNGESFPIIKRKDMIIYSGSRIIFGEGIAIVENIGLKSKLGKIINQLYLPYNDHKISFISFLIEYFKKIYKIKKYKNKINHKKNNHKYSIIKKYYQKLTNIIKNQYIFSKQNMIIIIFFIYFIKNILKILKKETILKSISTSINKSILIITIICPCSLQLAEPISYLKLSKILLKRGIIVNNISSIYNIFLLEYMFIDKTGTLTTDDFIVTDFIYNFDLELLLNLIIKLENEYNDSLSNSIINYSYNKLKSVNEYDMDYNKENINYNKNDIVYDRIKSICEYDMSCNKYDLRKNDILDNKYKLLNHEYKSGSGIFGLFKNEEEYLEIKLGSYEYINYGNNEEYNNDTKNNNEYNIDDINYYTSNIDNKEYNNKDKLQIKIYISINNKKVGYFLITQKLNKNTKEMINFLRRSKIEPIILTGDSKENTNKISKKLKINKKYTNKNSENKKNIIKNYKKYSKVGMIDDGYNDLLAIKNSNLGISLQSTKNSDLSIINRNLKSIEIFSKISKNTIFKLLFIYLVSIFYNLFFLLLNDKIVENSQFFNSLCMFLSTLLIIFLSLFL